MSLDAARERLAADDAEGALEALLSAWRETRAPDLADHIDRLDARITATLPAISGKGAMLHAAWMAVAEPRRTVDVGRLGAALLAGPIGSLPLRVDALLAHPDDPRVAGALGRLVAAFPTASSLHLPMWARTLSGLERLGDVRQRPVIEARLAAPTYTESQVWARLVAWAAQQAWAAPSPLALDGLEAAIDAVDPHVAPAPLPSREAPSPAALAAAVSTDEPPTVLAALLDLWRVVRAPAVAERISRVGRLLPDAPVSGATAKARQTAWLELAADADPAVVGRLLVGLSANTITDLEARLPALCERAADPRISAAVLDLLARSSASDHRGTFWTFGVTCVAHHADLQGLASLSAPRAPPRLASRLRIRSSGLAAAVRAALPDLAERLAVPVPEVEPDALEAVDRWLAAREAAAAAAEAEGAGLVARVLANEEGATQIFADWLSERGDPWGERLALARLPRPTAAQRKRLEVLEATRTPGLRWEDGLPTGLDLDRLDEDGWLRLRDRLELAFVQDLHLDQLGPLTPARLLDEARWLTSLRWVSGSPSMLTAVADRLAARGVRELRVWWERDEDEDFAVLLPLFTAVRLERLEQVSLVLWSQSSVLRCLAALRAQPLVGRVGISVARLYALELTFGAQVTGRVIGSPEPGLCDALRASGLLDHLESVPG